jgi:hypothetical protein
MSIMFVESSELDRRFLESLSTPAKPGQNDRVEAIRNAARALAALLQSVTPPSREQHFALAKLEEAVFWANAAIARREEVP